VVPLRRSGQLDAPDALGQRGEECLGLKPGHVLADALVDSDA
jgi:hypothetical protein